jgi:hypothetical protein
MSRSIFATGETVEKSNQLPPVSWESIRGRCAHPNSGWGKSPPIHWFGVYRTTHRPTCRAPANLRAPSRYAFPLQAPRFVKRPWLGDIVILDSLSRHEVAGVRQARSFSKLKALLRQAATRTVETPGRGSAHSSARSLRTRVPTTSPLAGISGLRLNLL